MAKLVLTIDFDPTTGECNLNGQLGNVLVVDHMLAQGKRIYDGWLAQQKAQRKVLPVTSIEGLIKPNGHPR